MADIDDLRRIAATYGQTHYGHTSDQWRMDCDGCERTYMGRIAKEWRRNNVQWRRNGEGITYNGEGMAYNSVGMRIVSVT